MDINWIVDSPFEALPVGDRHATAISVDGREELTWEELRDRRNRFVHVLLGAGVGPGDRVGLLMLNSLDYVALYFAVTRIGAIAVRLNFRLAGPELRYILNDSGCGVVVLHSSRAAHLESIRADVSVGRWLCLPESSGDVPDWAEVPALETFSGEDPDLPRPAGTDPVMLMYTSGTTGRPKGSVWTHENSLWTASIQANGWSFSPRTVALTTGPLFHVGAFEAMLLPALLVHGTGVITSSTGMTIDRFVSTVQAAQVTHALLYPFMLYDLLRTKDLDRDRLASLNLILCGGDPVQPWALKAIDEKLPGLAVQQGYGLTEGGSMCAILDHEDRLLHPDSVGRPFPLTQIRTVAATGELAGPDEIGEVWVRSPAISGRYWNMPEESRATFVDGWCRTGDLGRVTPDGFLVLTGRSKDMIRSGGENIYPAEVESVLADHPDVAAVAVVAVPHEKYLEVGCAVVQPTPGRPDTEGLEADLRRHVEENLARYKCPRHYVFVNEMPVNPAGKVQKRVLRERYAVLGSAPREVSSS